MLKGSTMDGAKSKSRPVVGRGWWRLPLILAALLLTTNAGHAAAIRTARVGARSASYYEAYFRRALQQRSLSVQIPKELRTLRLQSNGLLPQTAFVDYLYFRRSLNPTRFDSWHPNVGRMLVQSQTVRPSVKPQVVPPTQDQNTVPPTQPPYPPPPLPPPLPPTVPEPSSFVIVGFLAMCFVGRRQLRRMSQPGVQVPV